MIRANSIVSKIHHDPAHGAGFIADYRDGRVLGVQGDTAFVVWPRWPDLPCEEKVRLLTETKVNKGTSTYKPRSVVR